MHLCFACQTSPLCTFAFHAIHHYAPLVFMHSIYPSPLRSFSFWENPQCIPTCLCLPLTTTNTPSQGQPLSILQHYELSLPGTSIYLSPLRTLPSRDLYLSLTTTNSPSQGRPPSIPHNYNSPSQGRPPSIPHHYELSLLGATSSIPHHYKLSLPGVNATYPSPLRTLPPRGDLHLSLTTTTLPPRGDLHLSLTTTTLPPRGDHHLSLTTTNSPSQWRPPSIPHHYELSLSEATIYPSQLRTTSFPSH